MTPCTIDTEKHNGVVILRLVGTLVDDDTACVKAAAVDAVTKGSTKIVIEMSGVKLINSDDLGALVAVTTYCKENGAQMVLLNPSEKTLELLKITKLQTVILLAQGTLDDALALFESGS